MPASSETSFLLLRFDIFRLRFACTSSPTLPALLAMSLALKTLLVSVAAIVLMHKMSAVHAHGIISYPKATYINETSATFWNIRITASQTRAAFQGLKWDDTPTKNVATFTKAYDVSGFSSIKQMVNGFVPGCQNTRIDVPAQSVKGNNTMVWRNDNEQAGFIQTHHGPCEIWVDNTRVFFNTDCAAAYTDYPAILPANYTKCESTTCTLTFYWLAIHEPLWQIYKQCVPITLH